MKRGRIVIVTGAPGTGKTTVAEQLARESARDRSVHLHTDDFYHYLSKGAIAPHLPASDDRCGKRLRMTSRCCAGLLGAPLRVLHTPTPS